MQIWLVWPAGAHRPSIASWRRADAVAASADGSTVVAVELLGERVRCRLCGEPAVLDDPTDGSSWIHAPDANDRGDHTAEV